MLEQYFITVDGYRVRYIEDGKANAKHILCLHGLGASAGRWIKIMPILAKEYHVVAPDILGFGYSDKPDAYYTMDFFVNFVKKFVKKLKMERVILVGGSLGGHIAIETALTHDNMVEKMVLVSPAGMLKEPTSALNHYIAAAMYPTFENAKKAFQEMSGSKNVDEIYTRDFINRMQLPNAKYAFMSAIMGDKSAPSLVDRLARIKTLTLIIWGKKDALIPQKFAKQFHSGIKGSELAIMVDCGHTPYFEKPERFCEIVLKFLRN
ncbi:MAG: alpha/beta fold hydrolase [Nitrososphaerales archaeon]